MFNNWELDFVPLLTYESAFLGLSVMHFQHQCLHQNHGVSPSRPQVHPPGCSEMLTGGSVYLVSVEIVSQATDTNTASGQLVVVAFHSSSRTHQLSDLAYCPRSVRAAVRLYPHESLQDVCYFLSSSFYKLWILWDLCKHPKVALIEVNDSLLLIKK